MRRSFLASVIFIWVFSCVSCSGDGTEPYALWNSYRPANDAYELHYPAPPWRLISEQDSGEAVFVMDNGANSLVGRFSTWLELDVSLDEFMLMVRDEYVQLGCRVEPFDSFENAFGDQGASFEVMCDDVRTVELAFDSTDSVVRLKLEVFGDMPEKDIQKLLEGFRPLGDF